MCILIDHLDQWDEDEETEFCDNFGWKDAVFAQMNSNERRRKRLFNQVLPLLRTVHKHYTFTDGYEL